MLDPFRDDRKGTFKRSRIVVVFICVIPFVVWRKPDLEDVVCVTNIAHEYVELLLSCPEVRFYVLVEDVRTQVRTHYAMQPKRNV
jgi:hypothetical protein